MRNLSLGGVFLAIAPPLPIGTGISFWLTILGHRMLIRGHVRWTRSLPAGPDAPVGIGIEYYDPDGTMIEEIQAQLIRLDPE